MTPLLLFLVELSYELIVSIVCVSPSLHLYEFISLNY